MKPYQVGDNVFQTGADQRFNSFSSPSAIAFNQSNGQWGVNPNLLTPAYTSAYRPSYNGNQGNNFGGPQPGFSQSFNQVFNPFASGGNNYGGNTYQQQSPYFDTLGYNPLDHATNIAQKWVVPGFASWLSYKYLAKPLGNMGERFTAGAITGIAGGSFSAGKVATMANWGGKLGGFAAGALLPAVVAEGVSWGVDKALFDPYVGQRQTTNDLRRNFSGVTFSDQSGNNFTGKGFSRRAAAEQASRISEMGARDFVFNQSEMANLTDLSARSGLLDTVQGGQISDRMRSIVKQVKTVMQIGNTSDFKEAIEILSKLQMSGVSSKDVTAVTTRLGGMASAAGVSLQRMMSTVGAQGEYLFASNGMTPYVGQMAAANAYGAFSAAQRGGLISNALLARMGGAEGATQSATAGLVAMAQTPYAKFSAFNTYLNGGNTSNFVGNISRMGGAIAGSPLEQIGRLNATAAELGSKSLEEGGLQGQWQRFMEMSRMIPGAINQKTGKVDYYTAYTVMTSAMGLTDDQAKALLEQKRISQDSGAQALIQAGLVSASKETMAKGLENVGLGYGRLNPVVRPITMFGHEIQAAGAGFVGGVNKRYTQLIDQGEEFILGARYGEDQNPITDQTKKTINTDFDKLHLRSFGQETARVTDKIMDTITDLKGDRELIELLESKSPDKAIKIRQLLSIKAANGEIDSDFTEAKNLDALVNAVMSRSVMTETGPKPKTTEDITGLTGKAAEDMAQLAMDYQHEGKMTADVLNRYIKITGDTSADALKAQAAFAEMGIRGAGLDRKNLGSMKLTDTATVMENLKLWETKRIGRQAVSESEAGTKNQQLDTTLRENDLRTMEVKTGQINISGPVTINSGAGSAGPSSDSDYIGPKWMGIYNTRTNSK